MEHPAESNRELDLPLTTLIGRSSELSVLDEFLRAAEPRLIILTGPGGVGKSRLAIQAADAARATFDQVVLTSLASISDPAQVLPALARSFGVVESGGAALGARLAAALAGGSTLAVIDNFEQVVPAATHLVDLLRHAPGLKVLVTSRALLGVRGEQEFPVLPLRLPPDFPSAAPLTRRVVVRYSAISLFVARARLVDPAFRLTDRNVEDVVAICRRLDGLPLAIELAAARLRLVALPVLRTLLEQRLAVLSGGPRDHPARLRSMRDAIAWSYDLLEPKAQVLFQVLSAFDGGFSLRDAQVLVGIANKQDVGDVPVPDDSISGCSMEMLDGVAALAGQSLVRRDDSTADLVAGQPRFSMLETIRTFAADQLSVSGNENTVLRRHAAIFCALAERSAAEIVGPRERETIDRLEGESGNLRAALTWLIRWEPAAAVEMAANLWLFWYRTGRVAEGENWLRRGLSQLGDQPRIVRGKGLFVWGALATVRGEFTFAESQLEQSLDLLKDNPDPTSLALAETSLGVSSLYSGKPDVAIAALLRAARLYPLASTTAARALGAFSQCQLIMARHLLQPAPTDVEDLGRAVDNVRESGSRLTLLPALSMKATVCWNLGDIEQAELIWREALNLAWSEGERWQAVDPLFGLSAVLAEKNEPRMALRLLGAVDACSVATGTIPLIAGAMTSRIEERTRGDLSSSEISHLRAEGAATSLRAIVGNLLPAPPMDGERALELSPRERDVLRLLADGRSDPEIAATLFVSRRTVATHVERVFRKLGVHSRAAASARAVRLDLI